MGYWSVVRLCCFCFSRKRGGVVYNEVDGMVNMCLYMVYSIHMMYIVYILVFVDRLYCYQGTPILQCLVKRQQIL